MPGYTISEVAQGVGGYGEELAEKAREVTNELLSLAKEAPDEAVDVTELTQTTKLSPATRKIISLVKRIEADEDDEHEGAKRQAAAARVHSGIMALRGAFAMLSGEPMADYPEEVLTSDMNEVSFKKVIVPELHLRRLGPAQFGEGTEDEPVFPLLGAVLTLYPSDYQRNFFTLIVEYKGTKHKLPFFVDTGGKQALANRNTLKLLNPRADLSVWTTSTSLNVMIHGVPTPLHHAADGTPAAEVNLLGTDWMAAAGVTLVCDYSAAGKGCGLVKSEDPRELTIRAFAPPPVIEGL